MPTPLCRRLVVLAPRCCRRQKARPLPNGFREPRRAPPGADDMLGGAAAAAVATTRGALVGRLPLRDTPRANSGVKPALVYA